MTHPLITKTRNLIDQKKTNLSLSADLQDADEILNVARKVGNKICILKTHIDIVENFSQKFTTELRAIADDLGFLIFEDRKFADIDNTVSMQFSGGIYHIAEWADFINAHTIVGPGIIEGLQRVNKQSGLILLAHMTSIENLFTPSYTEETLSMAQQYSDFVVGFIASSNDLTRLKTIRKSSSDMLVMTPGIKIGNPSNVLKQSYNTPERAIENGADVVIVGRGIYTSNDPVSVAETYRARAWDSWTAQQQDKS